MHLEKLRNTMSISIQSLTTSKRSFSGQDSSVPHNPRNGCLKTHVIIVGSAGEGIQVIIIRNFGSGLRAKRAATLTTVLHWGSYQIHKAGGVEQICKSSYSIKLFLKGTGSGMGIMYTRKWQQCLSHPRRAPGERHSISQPRY